MLAAEKELAHTKAQIKALSRQARQAEMTEEQLHAQVKIRDLQRKQRRQRQRIFDVEDDMIEKRDELIEAERTRRKPCFRLVLYNAECNKGRRWRRCSPSPGR